MSQTEAPYVSLADESDERKSFNYITNSDEDRPPIVPMFIRDNVSADHSFICDNAHLRHRTLSTVLFHEEKYISYLYEDKNNSFLKDFIRWTFITFTLVVLLFMFSWLWFCILAVNMFMFFRFIRFHIFFLLLLVILPVIYFSSRILMMTGFDEYAI